MEITQGNATAGDSLALFHAHCRWAAAHGIAAGRSLQGIDSIPLHIQGGDGRIVNRRGPADEKQDVFVVGRFHCLADAQRSRLDGADFLKADGAPSVVRIFHISAQSFERLPRDGRDFSIIAHNTPHPAGGENVLAIQHGVVKQKLKRAGRLDAVTLDHVFLPVGKVYFSEGAETARSIAQALAHWSAS